MHCFSPDPGSLDRRGMNSVLVIQARRRCARRQSMNVDVELAVVDAVNLHNDSLHPGWSSPGLRKRFRDQAVFDATA